MSDTALDPQVFRIGMSREQADAQPDPKAPFGREEDGTPVAPFGLRIDGGVKLKPGKVAAKNRGDRPPSPRAPQKRRSGPRRRPTTGSSSPSRGAKRGSAQTDYRAAIRDVAESAYQLLIWAGEHDRIFYADAAVVATVKEPLAEGLNPIVGDIPWLAKAVTWWGQNSRYTGLGLALSQAAAQLVANHVPALRTRLVKAGLATMPDLIIKGVELELLRAVAADREEAANVDVELDQLRAELDDRRSLDDTAIYPEPRDLVGEHDELHGLAHHAGTQGFASVEPF